MRLFKEIPEVIQIKDDHVWVALDKKFKRIMAVKEGGHYVGKI